MKLYGAMLSPYVVRVVLVARAKGLDIEVIHPPGEGPEREAYLKVNPSGKMPFLQDGDFALIESAVIADYLDATLPGPALWPNEPRARAKAGLLARLVDVWIAPGSSSVMLAIRDNLPADTREEGWVKLAKGLELMSYYREADDVWLAGDSFGHADAAMIPWLFSAECFNADSGIATHIAEHCPDLAAYWARVKETPTGARIYKDMDARAKLVFGGSIRTGPKNPAEAAAMTARATAAATAT
jgi:glutathione S-transferase